MGAHIMAVTGVLLCLLSGALMPGEAEAQTTTDGSSDLSEGPGVTPSPSILTSSHLQDTSAASSDPEPLTASSEDNENIPENEQPLSTSIRPDSDSTTTAAETAAPEEVTDSDLSTSTVAANPDTVEVTSASVTQPAPTTQPRATAKSEDPTAETPNLLTETSKLLHTLGTPAIQTQPGTESPVATTEPATKPASIHATWMSAITTSLFITTTVTTRDPTSMATPHTTRAEVRRGPSVLEVGDQKELPSFHPGNSSNPLFVMIVSVFTIMVVMVVVVVGFQRYKRRTSRTEFRRLQDLPMDDMMEDTPLSLYSY